MYKANKPCKFGDRQFYIGDEIPEELIDQNRVKTLIQYGTILNVPDAASEPPKAETGTNTSTERGSGSEDDKQAQCKRSGIHAGRNSRREAKPEKPRGRRAGSGWRVNYTYNPAEIATESVSRARFELGDVAVDGGAHRACYAVRRGNRRRSSATAPRHAGRRQLFRLADAGLHATSRYETDLAATTVRCFDLAQRAQTAG